MRYSLALGFALISLCAAPAQAQMPTGFFKLYSDMCLNRASHDPRGVRIGFMRILGASYIFFEGADGWKAPAQIIPYPQILPRNGQPLHFAISLESGKKVMFDGAMTERAIDGNLAGIAANDVGQRGRPAHLPEVDAEAHLPNCG